MNKIESKLKPLYANLKRLEIGYYLHSKKFEYLMIENNVDELWDACMKDTPGSKYRGFSINIDYYEEAIIHFLSVIYRYGQNPLNVDHFPKYIFKILEDFISWKSIKIDIFPTFKNLKELDLPQQELLAFIKRVRAITNIKPTEEATIQKTLTAESKKTKDIFIVHGHNDTLKAQVCNILFKLKLNPVVLHEQANSGKTIIEKFEKFSDVGFAIVLLTDDDIGRGNAESEFKNRARQNVILELGYFIGKLGRQRVLPLYIKGIELPSDINGLSYVPVESVYEWQHLLVRELSVAGYNIDTSVLYR